jgi:hypothetical protein
MTAVGDADDMTDDPYVDRVETLSRATVRLSFNPFVDIDWDAPENALDGNDPRWQLDPNTAPLAATDWYAEQPLKQRIDMGRWITANTFKVGIQFEMILIRGVGICCMRSPMNAITSRCSRSSSIAMTKTYLACGGCRGS